MENHTNYLIQYLTLRIERASEAYCKKFPTISGDDSFRSSVSEHVGYLSALFEIRDELNRLRLREIADQGVEE